MSIGIYKLKFNGTTKVYIGQSIQIEVRYRQHLNKLVTNTNSNYKLQAAFFMYGLPTLEILEICENTEKLNDRENYYINEYNSVNNGFNINKYANQTPILYGENAGFAKYLFEDYFCVLYYLGFEEYSINRICEITEVSKKVVEHICYEKAHAYLEELFPEMYKKMLDINKYGRNNAVARTGKQLPKLISPDGIVFSIKNVSRFAKEQGLLQPKIHEVLHGTRTSHKGWKIYNE